MAIHTAVLQLFELLVGRDAAPAATALDELREGELLALGLRNVLILKIALHFLEELFGDERLMLALIPFPASFRIFELAVVEGVAEADINIGE